MIEKSYIQYIFACCITGFNAVMELIRIMSMNMLKKCMAVGLLVSVLTSSGCAVVMASN